MYAQFDMYLFRFTLFDLCLFRFTLFDLFFFGFALFDLYLFRFILFDICVFRFTRFDLEASSRCTYDYVAVYDGPDMNSSSLIGQYCGSVTPLKIVSTSNTLLVNFVTDRSVSKEGFQAAYRSVFGESTQCNQSNNQSRLNAIKNQS